jgi:hypothetical protein
MGRKKKRCTKKIYEQIMNEVIEKWETKQQRKVYPYWYHTTIYMCVLCGCEDKYRERRYDPKPENPADRINIIQNACNTHFI